jgi:hypothetical protein
LVETPIPLARRNFPDFVTSGRRMYVDDGRIVSGASSETALRQQLIAQDQSSSPVGGRRIPVPFSRTFL